MNMAVIDHLIHVYMTGELHEYSCNRSPPSFIHDWGLHVYNCFRSPPSCIHDWRTT